MLTAMLRRAVGGLRVSPRPAARPAGRVAAPCVCGSAGVRGLVDQRVVAVAPLATAASRWPSWGLGERATVLAPPTPLDNPWRGGLAGRGFANAVRVSINTSQVRNQDPQQMLNMFRRKCRQNNIHSNTRAKRYHKKPTHVRRKRVTSLSRRRVLHRVKGKVWNYLLTKQEKAWDQKNL